MKKLPVSLCAIVLFNAFGFSQDQHLIDSLQVKLKQLEGERTELRNGALSLTDSSTVKILRKLALIYKDNDPYRAMEYTSQCLALSEQIGWKKGVARALTEMGNNYSSQGNYSESLKSHFASIEIWKDEGDKNAIGYCYNNIGVVYTRLGNYPEALKNYYASLKIHEEFIDKRGARLAYNNLGIVNSILKNNTEALKNYSISLQLANEMGDKAGAAIALGNVGTIYLEEGDYDNAMKNLIIVLKIFEEIGHKYDMSVSYDNIGLIYSLKRNYPEALKNYLASLKIREEVGYKDGIAFSCNSLGQLHIDFNRINEGRKWYERGLSESKQIGYIENIMLSYYGLARADSATGNYKGALENHKMYIQYKDSMFNQANTKKATQQEMQYEFDKKEALTKAEQEKKDALALEEIENQKLVRNGFMGGFATVIIFAGTFFRQRNKIKLEKKRSDQLLRNILPDEIAEELKETGSTKAKTHEMVSVMFTDFKDFTKISESISAEMLVEELHTCFSAFDNILLRNNIEKIKTIGDAYMCVSGAPVHNQNHATDIVKAAIEIMEYVTIRKKEKDARGEFSFELRIGINSGPVVAGIVGLEKFSYDIWGDTVNTAARMEKQGEAGKINISGTTYELIKNEFSCIHRGKITAKNKGEIDMYFLEYPTIDSPPANSEKPYAAASN